MQNKVTIRNTHTLLVEEYMTHIGECNMQGHHIRMCKLFIFSSIWKFKDVQNGVVHGSMSVSAACGNQTHPGANGSSWHFFQQLWSELPQVRHLLVNGFLPAPHHVTLQGVLSGTHFCGTPKHVFSASAGGAPQQILHHPVRHCCALANVF